MAQYGAIATSDSPEKHHNCNEEDQLKSNPSSLVYRIDQKPQWLLSFFLGFQQYLTMFGATLGIPFALMEPLCLANDPAALGEVISTLFFCSGLVTLLQSTFGVRLPIVQGGTYAFLAPTKAITSVKATNCTMIVNGTNGTTMEVPSPDEWKLRMREIQGAIMVSSLFQIVIGCTGIMGFILKFIGPLTICPTIVLIGLPLYGSIDEFESQSWGIAIAMFVSITVFSQVLKEVSVPNPCGGQRIQIFQLFPILFSIVVCWGLAAILTVANVYEKPHRARTDFRINIISDSAWFRVPYPGQWGVPIVTVAGVFGMLAGVLASMLESIGDYYACAKIAGAPPPPKHAINRGLLTEGIGCMITGLWGTGNGTTSYSENISAIGITRVGSLRVIRCGALIMIVLSIIGKFGALFATVPDPVVGGIFIVMFGLITGVGLSSLQYVDLSSVRNLYVLGTSLCLGLAIPYTLQTQKINIYGLTTLNGILEVLLSTHMAVGGLVGFILDNILPGTPEERGLLKWTNLLDNDGNVIEVASVHIFDPPFLNWLLKKPVCKWIPFLPYYENDELNKSREDGDEPILSYQDTTEF